MGAKPTVGCKLPCSSRAKETDLGFQVESTRVILLAGKQRVVHAVKQQRTSHVGDSQESSQDEDRVSYEMQHGIFHTHTVSTNRVAGAPGFHFLRWHLERRPVVGAKEAESCLLPSPVSSGVILPRNGPRAFTILI